LHPGYKLNNNIEKTVKSLLPDLIKNWDHIRSSAKIAKNKDTAKRIEDALSYIETFHEIIQRDSRNLLSIDNNSIQSIITSPPYWNLKKYSNNENQLGSIKSLNKFLNELDLVWNQCFRVMVPGARLICVISDICLSRKQNDGIHMSVPLHSYIQNNLVDIGFELLSPIIWNKITNANYEWKGSSPIYGSVYGPNSIIKNEIEFILIAKKPGGPRRVSKEVRLLSIIPKEDHNKWLNQIWQNVPGTSRFDHPAPYPLSLANRLVRMFSYVGDIVLDPFSGTGTTNVACVFCGRNSIGIDIEENYVKIAKKRVDTAIAEWQNKVVVPDLF